MDIIPRKDRPCYSGPKSSDHRLNSQLDCTKSLFKPERFNCYCYLYNFKDEVEIKKIDEYGFILKGILRCELSESQGQSAYLRRLFGVVKGKPKKPKELENSNKRKNALRKIGLNIRDDEDPLLAWRSLVNIGLIKDKKRIENCPLRCWNKGCHDKLDDIKIPLILIQFQDGEVSYEGSNIKLSELLKKFSFKNINFVNGNKCP